MKDFLYSLLLTAFLVIFSWFGVELISFDYAVSDRLVIVMQAKALVDEIEAELMQVDK